MRNARIFWTVTALIFASGCGSTENHNSWTRDPIWSGRVKNSTSQAEQYEGDFQQSPLTNSVLSSFPTLQPTSVIETRIDGTFNGWTGETVWRMTNGQIWQQTSYGYHYHYAYRPEVLIYQSSSGWKMKVDGDDEDGVLVRRLK